jgi:uncharacterized protein
MLKKTTLILALAAAAFGAQAQSSPVKKELIAKILKVQQPGIEALGRSLAEQPAAELTDRAGMALAERVPPERRETVAAEIKADVKKYLDEAVPLVQGRAVSLAPTTIGTLLEQKFSEEELRQVVAILESPAYNKFQQLTGDMQNVLGEKLLAETRATVEPKVVTLEQSIARRLGITVPAQGQSPSQPLAPSRPAAPRVPAK